MAVLGRVGERYRQDVYIDRSLLSWRWCASLLEVGASRYRGAFIIIAEPGPGTFGGALSLSKDAREQLQQPCTREGMRVHLGRGL